MSTTPNFDRLARAWLEEGPMQLSDHALEAVLDEVHLTQQRRALRVPWRFPTMPALTRATAIAAVALVAAVGAGGIIYLGAGGQPTPSPAPSRAPTAAFTTEPTAAAATGCPEVAPGICGWKTYTSAVYGYTISYPDDWTVADRATEEWQPGDPEDAPVADVFLNPEAVDGDSMVFFALQFPGPAGADLGSWGGLLAALTEMCAQPTEFREVPCPEEGVKRMCLGTACQPVAFVHANGGQPRALFGDPETGIVTYLQVGRVDNFAAARRYGGTAMLLDSILRQLGVREPGPGETPN